MDVFIDSADYRQIEIWLRQGVVDGVTTNPSIMLKDGVKDLQEGVLRIADLLEDRPLSVEVASNDPETMLEEAREFAAWAANIVVKIPIINERGESCLGVIHELSQSGVRVNATALLSFNQAMLAAKAGATYVSLFSGRIADEGHDPVVVIGNVRQWLESWSEPARIIVGSIRAVIDVQNAALAGAHIITIPPPFLSKMLDHQYTRETVRQFVQDAEKTIALMTRAKLQVAAAGR